MKKILSLVTAAVIAIGAAAFSSISASAETYKPGDADGNGEVDIVDVAMIMNHINGVKALDGSSLKRADFDGADGVDIVDVVGIIRSIVGEMTVEKKPEDDYTDECSILRSMYAKGYIPAGTYSGSYITYDSYYGNCAVFNGTNRNGGSGTQHSYPYSFTDEDEAGDTFGALYDYEKKANEIWNNGTVKDIMKGTNYGRYDTTIAYFIAALMDGDNQYSGMFMLPF